MAIQTLTTIKNWFKSTLKPTEVQYRDTWDSFYHKLEGIGISAITNLSNILNNKADVGQLDGKADKGHGHVVGDTEDLENILENKADKTHSHNIDDVDGLQDTFNDQYLYFNNAVNDEITQRKEADEALQDEIDSLKKITMIRGNVDTYADLLAMDTATIREGDSYIVEKDEARAGKSTLYIWTDAGWVYTGEWASGGSSENLGNTDLVQSRVNRTYTVPQGMPENDLPTSLTFKFGEAFLKMLEENSNGEVWSYFELFFKRMTFTAKEHTIFDTCFYSLRSEYYVNINTPRLRFEGILNEEAPFTVLTLDRGGEVTGRKLELYTLPQVSDSVANPNDGDVLMWDAGLRLWVNTPSSGPNLEHMRQTLDELYRRVEQLEQMQ